MFIYRAGFIFLAFGTNSLPSKINRMSGTIRRVVNESVANDPTSWSTVYFFISVQIFDKIFHDFEKANLRKKVGGNKTSKINCLRQFRQTHVGESNKCALRSNKRIVPVVLESPDLYHFFLDITD